ncbi:zinc metallopeptidase [Anoxybacillus sp. LAT_35]|uniref:Predicted Zn-dependent protease n=1 Tax=Anoxybacillus flavithermus (strain DSM 21510 / WK1) TaxID=491915 RepID=B7GEZ3_ANOFW|nr:MULTISPECIES: zinc metallopeptidase [Anoxybacillus]MCG5025181.1 zinc metallopeptidase [Anoxybacillus flavithermus]MCG6199031.1 zinc metallopeptidase [Anoxybacillus sp. LAT_38]ACJ34698.1 Predicted Zn-dependent protease [Anoxybacillus flavithermus WK1]MCG3084997.1 zinc metallopeptidase [Anoxybacillus sp. LAT27]MCG6171747.1 zinc metallopeptidase [Anoxybacillus sp. LAT_11]
MFFHPMDFLILIAFGVSIWAQFKVKGNFSKWSDVPASSGLTGAEVARLILDRNGLYDVPVELVPGTLTDHYDPIARAVRLSEPVYYGRSIAAVSVAAHEVGHAVQHQQAYGALVLRHRMFPLVNFTSGIAPFLLLGGFLMQQFSLIGLGIILFSFAVAFQVITLPVEFNASSRAKDFMIAEGIIRNEEERGVNKVLNAAALTYVAAALISVLELIKYVLIFAQGNDED